MAYADAATPYDALSMDQCQQQVQRIVRSSTFRNALTLQQLFQFVADKAISGAAEGLKEYTIGVEAFGRKQDFDPKTDPIVRVQIHRLRQKLREYYELEGSHDPVLVEVPKGHYLPHFESVSSSGIRTASDSVSVATLLGDKTDTEAIEPSADRRRVSGRAALLAAGAVLFVAGLWVGGLRTRTGTGLASANSVSGRSSDPVKMFWGTFLGSDSAPIIAYPDAVFLLDDSNDLFRFRQGASDERGALVDPHLAERFASNPALIAKAGQLYYENGYTGTGELEAVGMLTELFGRMGVRPTIKSSRDITPDDLKQHNVILLGSPFQNVAVAQLVPEGDFAFDNPDSRREEWRAQITNGHPRANESPTYHTERDPVTRVLKVDYSLISIQPGIVSGRYIAILGGLDTKGTEGAMMFATSQTGLEALSQSLADSGISSPKGRPPVFQALIRVQLEKGYEVLSSALVTVHRLGSRNANGSQPSSR